LPEPNGRCAQGFLHAVDLPRWGEKEVFPVEGFTLDDQLDSVDFALAAYRDDGAWQLQDIAAPSFGSVEALGHALRRLPGDAGAVAMIAVDEDFFVIVRVQGPATRVLLSDITAADEWELAQSALRFLGLPVFGDLEDEDVAPAGDLDLLGDLGMPAMDLAALIDDDDLYPDEMLSEVARSLGFGELFDDAVGFTSA
jgi:putative tRNA adenosine deaminase-associated protein